MSNVPAVSHERGTRKGRALTPDEHSTLPPRFIDLKIELVKDRERLQNSWNDLLAQLKSSGRQRKKDRTDNMFVQKIIPQVEFSELQNLSPGKFKDIKRRGAVLVKNVVDSAQATAWRDELTAFVKTTLSKFFQLYWTRPQIQARAHPNVLSLISWLNSLYYIGTFPKNDQVTSVDLLKGVELSTPLVYADRFRVRHPGAQWNTHPPHIDGGGIERWEDANFRSCYNDILNGEWEKHDPYDLAGRLNAKMLLYGRPGQCVRTFQGWIALSETAPTQGTLKVFPDVTLSNASLILRPFFHLKKKLVSDDSLDQQNWEFDISTPDFPGIFERDGGFFGPRLTHQSHPHLRLSESMTSVPLVRPVMYIPAVPLTPQNLAYIERQKESFLKGIPPPDFPNGAGEDNFIGTGRETDVIGETARKAMGIAY
ncbi:DUF1479-domain-containing protein [Phellopilus nigrolimitatus]|nr:DUF1479-domain-containing protein [Phellopilus nigrolimitatus]